MNILHVYPKYPETFWSFKYALRFLKKKATYPPLGLLTVAALLPEDWNKKLVDMNIEELKDEDIKWADYIFVSAMEVQRNSVQDIVNRAKRLGKKVVAGGPLFTIEFNAFLDIDHLVLGEGETNLPIFLEDLKKGTPKHIYPPRGWADLSKTPPPLWRLSNLKAYASTNIQYSRGCPYNCEFCDIPLLYGRVPRTKEPEQIIRELEMLKSLGWRGGVFFVDDNFIGNKKKLKAKVLPALIDWMEKNNYPFSFYTEASVNLADDEQLMKMMVDAGFNKVFVGIETPNEESLEECQKYPNKRRDLVGSVKRIQSFGIQVQGGFIVGFDHDPPSIFEKQVSFIKESKIVTAMVGLLNAPKGTRLYQRLLKENRIKGEITGDNTDFSTNIVPKMDLKSLLNGYKQILRSLYCPKEYYKRVKAFLEDYKYPKKKLRYIRLDYIGAFFRSLFLLGIKEKERIYYWKLLFWALFRKPTLLPMAISFAIYGYHFRKIFEKHWS